MEKYWEVQREITNAKNKEVINEFLLSLKLANRSEVTIIAYRRNLERFFHEQEELYSQLSSKVILDWLKTHLAHVKASSFSKFLSTLASFYTFCVKERHINRSPIKKRWYPRRSLSVPKYLEKEEIAKTRQQGEKEILRDQLLVEFMLTSGSRVGEIHRLNRVDVNIENRTARVLGKGGKIRTVHFTDRCAMLLEKYLESAPLSTALFCSSTGKRLSSRMIQVITQGIGKRAQLKSGLHPHRLRHTFATELLAKGADLSFIGDELGHKNLSTTSIYARLPKQQIISLYRKYMG